MKRILSVLFVLLASSCQLPPERAPIRALPEDSPPLPYAELLTRARVQSTSATESFYLNQWSEIEDTAKGLAQTARFLNKSVEVPEAKKKSLVADAAELNKAAVALAAAAKDKDEKKTNAALQQVNLLVRQLRPPD